jgi:hypothetical protein
MMILTIAKSWEGENLDLNRNGSAFGGQGVTCLLRQRWLAPAQGLHKISDSCASIFTSASKCKQVQAGRSVISYEILALCPASWRFCPSTRRTGTWDNVPTSKVSMSRIDSSRSAFPDGCYWMAGCFESVCLYSNRDLEDTSVQDRRNGVLFLNMDQSRGTIRAAWG